MTEIGRVGTDLRAHDHFKPRHAVHAVTTAKISGSLKVLASHTSLSCAAAVAQARAIASIVASLPVDGIFTSPLGRAHSTAAIIGARINRTTTVFEELAEVDHGAFAGLTNEEIEVSHPGVLARRASRKYTWRFPGGESYRDADRRAGRALRRIEATGVRRPVLVTHEMVGLMLLRHLLGLPPPASLVRSLPQGIVVHIRPADGAMREILAE